MKRIKLSDHTAEQISAAQKMRADEYALRLELYARAMSDKRQLIEAALENTRTAWRERRWFAALGNRLIAAWRAAFGWPKQPAMLGQTHGERVWEAGNEGESKVALFLGAQFDDAWTLVIGYKNPLGEIDQILVGPRGVITLEIKHINGRVTIEGDAWHLDKYDKYGNLVERNRRIADRGGRSPSRQLNEPTDRMLQFLGKSLPGLTARRIVVLSHERAGLERASNPATMVAIPTSDSLGRLIREATATLTPDQCARVVDLLKRDHAFHLKRGAQRQAERASASTAR